jgi:hypothetical protein
MNIYKKQLKNLLKLKSKEHPEILKWKIDVDRFCSDCNYRARTIWKLKHIEKHRASARNRINNNRERAIANTRRWQRENRQHITEQAIRWQREHPERAAIIRKRYCERHPEYTRTRFQSWTINNPKRAMLCAATSRMASTVISKL